MHPDQKPTPPTPRRIDWQPGAAPVGAIQSVTLSTAPDAVPVEVTWRGEPATISQLLDVRDAARSFVTLWDLAQVLGIATQSGAHVVPLLAAVDTLRRALHAAFDAAALRRAAASPVDPIFDLKANRPNPG